MKKTGYTIGSLIILLICAFVFVILPTFTGASSKQGNALVFGNYDGKEIFQLCITICSVLSEYGSADWFSDSLLYYESGI